MIEVSNLTKQFGSKTAVDNLSFSVGKGEVLGFLGPNGAGKSTTMRMITGYLPPTRGSVTVGGADMVSNPVAAKKKIGYLPENAPLYPDMTVQGFLGFIAGLRGLRAAQKKAAVERSLELRHVGFGQPCGRMRAPLGSDVRDARCGGLLRGERAQKPAASNAPKNSAVHENSIANCG